MLDGKESECAPLSGTLIFFPEGQDFGILALYWNFCRSLGRIPEDRLEMAPHANMAPHQAKQEQDRHLLPQSRG
jgi:hypothetical protein